MEVYDKQIELSLANEDTALAIQLQISKGIYMVFGWNDVDGAWKEAEKTFPFQESHSSSDYWFQLSYLNTYSGKYAEAEKMAKGIGDTQHQRILSLIHSAKHECTKAESFADLYLRSFPGFRRALLLYPLAECQYEKEQWGKSVETLLEVQNVYTNVSSPDIAVYYPKSFYLLGKVYEKKSEKNLAIQNYEKFLALWKDADKDLPELIDAKQRLAKLKGTA